MPKHGQKQNEATRRATRRNYALFQAMGMNAINDQIRILAVGMTGRGFTEVQAATHEVESALMTLIGAIEEWDPNK